MSLSVKDGSGAATALKSSMSGSDHVVHHMIDGVPVAAALADAVSNPSTISLAAAGLFFNGTTWDRMRGDTTNGLDVDVTRIIPGTGATHLGKAEDAAAASGDVGVAALAVRRDASASGVGSDGDYANLAVDANGRLWTHDELGPTEANLTAVVGATNEAAAGTDTATSGLNGLFKRLLQRFTAFLALIPAALTAGGNFKTALQEAIPAGTANIGDVDVATIAAGTTTIGGVMAEHVNESVRIGTTQYTVKRAQVRSAINNSEVVVVAGVASKKIRVLFITISANATFQFELRSNSTTIVGAIGIVANNTLAPNIPVFGYWAETVAGEDLRIFTSGNTSVGVVVNYIEV